MIAVKVVSSPQQSHADMKVGKMKLMGCQVCKGQIEDPLSFNHCPGNDVKLIRCVLGMTISSVVVQSMTVNQLLLCLRGCAFRHVDEGVSGGKLPSWKGCG